MFSLHVSLLVFSFQLEKECQWNLLVHILPIWAACGSTAECFRDKLPIFTPATLTYNYPVNRFTSDTNKATASLKVLESLSDKCKLPTSCTLTSQPKYHHVFVFDRRKIRKIKLLECCKRERRPTISQKISLPIQSPFNKKKMHPINERNTVSTESVSPRKPNTHVNTRYLPRTRATYVRNDLCALSPLTKRPQCHCLSWLLGTRLDCRIPRNWSCSAQPPKMATPSEQVPGIVKDWEWVICIVQTNQAIISKFFNRWLIVF